MFGIAGGEANGTGPLGTVPNGISTGGAGAGGGAAAVPVLGEAAVGLPRTAAPGRRQALSRSGSAAGAASPGGGVWPNALEPQGEQDRRRDHHRRTRCPSGSFACARASVPPASMAAYPGTRCDPLRRCRRVPDRHTTVSQVTCFREPDNMESSPSRAKKRRASSADRRTGAAPQRHDHVGGLEHRLAPLVVDGDLELHDPAIGVRPRRPGLRDGPLDPQRVAGTHRPPTTASIRPRRRRLARRGPDRCRRSAASPPPRYASRWRPARRTTSRARRRRPDGTAADSNSAAKLLIRSAVTRDLAERPEAKTDREVFEEARSGLMGTFRLTYKGA